MFATMHMKVADCGMLEYFFNIPSYFFDKEGVFKGIWTIHAEEGMRGTGIVSRSAPSP